MRWQESQSRVNVLSDSGGQHAHTKSGRAWLWVVGNALAGPAIGVSFQQIALRSTPTGIVLAIIAMTPLAVIPLARIFEGEKPTIWSLLGSAVAVAGAVGLTLLKSS